MIEVFLSDLQKFGGRRAMLRAEHRWRLQEFRRRQVELAAVTALFVLFAAAIGETVFMMPAALLASAGASEARRMRACGRDWQCKRSMEVIGE